MRRSGWPNVNRLVKLLESNAPNAPGRLRLLVFTEHRNATFFINFVYPLSGKIAGRRWDLIHFSADDFAGSDPAAIVTQVSKALTQQRPTAAIFSRYVAPAAPELMQLCRSVDIPVYFHIDDLLFNLPPTIGDDYQRTYNDAYRNALTLCLDGSDAILCSTQRLASAISKRYPAHRIEVLVGVAYLPDIADGTHLIRWLRRLKRAMKYRGTTVLGYMGSASHLPDLEDIVPAIEGILRSDPRVRFETFGLRMPQRLQRFGPERVGAIGYTRNYRDFLGVLFELGWDLGLAPIADHTFNRCKTATKFVEYTECAIPVLAANRPPFSALDWPTAPLLLADDRDWGELIRRLLDDRALRNRLLTNARALCESRFSLAVAAAALERAIAPRGAPRER